MADERSAATMIQEIEFAADSPLEGSGFELSVPLGHLHQTRLHHRVELYIDTGVSSAERGAARFGGGDGTEYLLWAAHQACGGVPAG